MYLIANVLTFKYLKMHADIPYNTSSKFPKIITLNRFNFLHEEHQSKRCTLLQVYLCQILE